MSSIEQRFTFRERLVGLVISASLLAIGTAPALILLLNGN